MNLLTFALFITIFLIFCAVNLHSCNEIVYPKDTSVEESLFTLTTNLQETKTSNDLTENLVFSPLGFSFLLGQIAAGANPTLRDGIGLLLGWKIEDLPNIHERHENLLKSYTTIKEKDEDTLKIRINSALFHRDYLKINKEYQILVQKHYDSQLIVLAENASESENQQTINNWVQNVTEGHIKDLPLTANTISLFANALYFNAEWLEPFSDQLTRAGKFFTTPDQNVNVSYLMGQQEILYMENHELNFKMIRLPYNSTLHNISMYIVSPQNHNLRNITGQMTLSKFLTYKANMTMKTVNIKMPKLAIKSKIHLRSTLEKYTENSTNGTVSKENKFLLSKVSDDSRSILSDVVQESTFNVHEKGTTFASLTAGYINYDGTARNCRVDQPYLAIIVDESKNLLLFWASIYQPAL
uniref:Putative serine proteinase inhibitor n=1 Tax=Lutzomyia longipalpis TaxID=7200 RepID=A0A7G3AXH0_LUTLO